MTGGANQFDATLPGLVVRLGANKRGQERMVDVDDAPRKCSTEFGGQNLHVAGKDHHIALGLGEEFADTRISG